MLIRNFAEDAPYYAAHDFRPFTACSIFLWFSYLTLYHFLGKNGFKQLNSMNKTKMTRREMSFDAIIGE